MDDGQEKEGADKGSRRNVCGLKVLSQAGVEPAIS